MRRPLRKLALLAAIGGGAAALVRAVQVRFRPAPEPEPVAPIWPPLSADDPAVQTEPVTAATPGAAAPRPSHLAAVPSAPAAPSGATWVDPDPDGGCRASHPVKANADSGIFHVPGGASYQRTKAERCYATPEEAEADGFRASRR